MLDPGQRSGALRAARPRAAADISGKVTTDEPPADDLHVQKAHLLENGGLVDFAVRELQAADTQDGNWALAETARLYQDSGRYDRAIEVMKHGVPNYFAVDVPELPRTYWEALVSESVLGRSEAVLDAE